MDDLTRLENKSETVLKDLLYGAVKDLEKEDYNGFIGKLKESINFLRIEYNQFENTKNLVISYREELSSISSEKLSSIGLDDEEVKRLILEGKEIVEDIEKTCKRYLKMVKKLLVDFRTLGLDHHKELKYFAETSKIDEEIEDIKSKFTDIVVKLTNINYEYAENTLKQTNQILLTESNDEIVETPFTDVRTHKLFNYIVDNWKYSADLKFGYILNFLNSNDSYLPHPKFNLNENYGFKMGVKYRSEYINFLGKEHDFYKDLQPEKAVAKRRYDELLTLYKTFREIYV